MERELMPDYAAEEFYRSLIPQNIFESPKKSKEDSNRCVVYCEKVKPGVLSIQGGFAFVEEEEDSVSSGMHTMSCQTRTFFILKKSGGVL
ncbi:MAG: hypothetical protein P9M07_05645 [Candidatus Aceula meridiana]|nr:hypothetical protein [Candidatus Aceula meridiana]